MQKTPQLVLGCSRHARQFITRLKKRGTLVAVVDRDSELLTATATEFGVPGYTSADDALRCHPECAVVDVFSPNARGEVARKVFAKERKVRHLLVEKPAALNSAIFDAMGADAARVDGQLYLALKMIGAIRPALDASRHLRRTKGQPRRIVLRWHGLHVGWRDDATMRDVFGGGSFPDLASHLAGVLYALLVDESPWPFLDVVHVEARQPDGSGGTVPWNPDGKLVECAMTARAYLSTTEVVVETSWGAAEALVDAIAEWDDGTRLIVRLPTTETDTREVESKVVGLLGDMPLVLPPPLLEKEIYEDMLDQWELTLAKGPQASSPIVPFHNARAVQQFLDDAHAWYARRWRGAADPRPASSRSDSRISTRKTDEMTQTFNIIRAQRPAILGGSPVRPRADGELIPHAAYSDQREKDAVNAVLDSGRWSGGPAHEAAIDELRKLTGAKHVVLCTNGTHAVYLANRVMGVKAWSRVWGPGLTWQGTFGPLLTLGAVPRMFDVSRSTLTLDVASVMTALWTAWKQGDPLPHIIWYVPLYCRLGDLVALRAGLDGFRAVTGIKVLLGGDFAHGPGEGLDEASVWARENGTSLLTLVDILTGSGQESKNAKGGDAGYVATNDAAVAEELVSQVNCGRPGPDQPEGQQSDQYRLASVVAAAWAVQLNRYRCDWLPVLRATASQLDAVARQFDGIEPLDEVEGVVNPMYKWVFRTHRLPAALMLPALEAELGYEVRGVYPALTKRDRRNPYYPDTAPTAAFSEEYRRLICELPTLPVAESAIRNHAAVEWAFALRADAPELLTNAMEKILGHAEEIETAAKAGRLKYSINW